MPHLKTYDLFLSHAWKYNSDYFALERLLKMAPLFCYRNYSVPINNPLIDPKKPIGKKLLTSALDKQVRPVNCVLIISGMYASHSEWIKKEISIAQKYKKPIIGIMPRGKYRVPLVVSKSAVEIVNWNTKSIVNAIRKYSI